MNQHQTDEQELSSNASSWLVFDMSSTALKGFDVWDMTYCPGKLLAAATVSWLQPAANSRCMQRLVGFRVVFEAAQAGCECLTAE